MTAFKIGDRVAIIPHRGQNDDGSVKEVFATVTNPHDPTDMTRLDGSPVGFYVRVIINTRQADLGYHEQSLQLAGGLP